jgi:hypothetical protein
VIISRPRIAWSAAFSSASISACSRSDFDHAVQTWRVAAVRTTRTRFEAASEGPLTPLVGRESDIGVLLDCWQLTREGVGQMVVVSGEPGIGKSRLLIELRQRLKTQVSNTLSLQCSGYHANSALYPIINCVHRMLGAGDGEARASKLDRLEALMQNHARPVKDVRLLAAMLSISEEERHGPLQMAARRQKEETIRALLDFLEAAARAADPDCVRGRALGGSQLVGGLASARETAAAAPPSGRRHASTRVQARFRS